MESGGALDLVCCTCYNKIFSKYSSNLGSLVRESFSLYSGNTVNLSLHCNISCLFSLNEIIKILYYLSVPNSNVKAKPYKTGQCGLKTFAGYFYLFVLF